VGLAELAAELVKGVIQRTAANTTTVPGSSLLAALLLAGLPQDAASSEKANARAQPPRGPVPARQPS
jgi:hypothetical protein